MSSLILQGIIKINDVLEELTTQKVKEIEEENWILEQLIEALDAYNIKKSLVTQLVVWN